MENWVGTRNINLKTSNENYLGKAGGALQCFFELCFLLGNRESVPARGEPHSSSKSG